MSSPQEKGRQYEKEFSKKHGFDPVPNSGATPFWKLDVDGKQILFSLKHTVNASISLKHEDLDEAKEAVYGIGGVGMDYTPAMVLSMKGEEYAVLRVDDLVKLLEQKIEFSPNKKKAQNVNDANIPGLLKRSLSK